MPRRAGWTSDGTTVDWVQLRMGPECSLTLLLPAGLPEET